MEETSLPLVVLHWALTAAALTPTVPSFALTPQRNAVAVPALSATCALVLYVWGVVETFAHSQELTFITLWVFVILHVCVVHVTQDAGH